MHNSYSNLDNIETITEWQQLIWLNDGKLLQRYSISDVGLFFVGTSGLISENVRRSKYYAILKILVNVFT